MKDKKGLEKATKKVLAEIEERQKEQAKLFEKFLSQGKKHSKRLDK